MIISFRFWASSLVGIIIMLATMAMMKIGLGSIIQLTSVLAITNFNTPELVGPSIMAGLICLLYGLMLNAFFIVPAKFALLAKDTLPENQSGAASDFSRKQIIGFLGSMSLAMLGLIFEGANAETYWSNTSLIVMLAPILSCYLVTPKSNTPSSTRQLEWYREAWISGAAIAVILNIMVIMQNLDKPALLGSLIGNSVLPILYGAAGVFLLSRTSSIRFSSQTH
jgi:flagellar motor component MotA